MGERVCVLGSGGQDKEFGLYSIDGNTSNFFSIKRELHDQEHLLCAR